MKTVSIEGLTCSDEVHYDERSQLVLGERFFQAYVALEKENKEN